MLRHQKTSENNVLDKDKQSSSDFSCLISPRRETRLEGDRKKKKKKKKDRGCFFLIEKKTKGKNNT
jgi:hypothetical protein